MGARVTPTVCVTAVGGGTETGAAPGPEPALEVATVMENRPVTTGAAADGGGRLEAASDEPTVAVDSADADAWEEGRRSVGTAQY